MSCQPWIGAGIIVMLGCVSVTLIFALIGCFYLGCATVMGWDGVDHQACVDDGEVIAYTVGYFFGILGCLFTFVLIILGFVIAKIITTRDRYDKIPL